MILLKLKTRNTWHIVPKDGNNESVCCSLIWEYQDIEKKLVDSMEDAVLDDNEKICKTCETTTKIYM